MNTFVDAGGWIAVVLPADRYHAIAVAHFRALLDVSAKLVTTDYVLDEAVTRLRYDDGHRTAVDFLDLIANARANGVLRVEPIDARLWAGADSLFRRYADARLSFTDGTSFAFLQSHPVDEVFGFDRHFEMMGFVLQPK